MQHKPAPELPKTGYALLVDGHVKTEFTTKEGAQRGAEDLKRRFPMLQIKVFDAQSQRSEEIALADT
jgi:hypothetical protein